MLEVIVFVIVILVAIALLGYFVIYRLWCKYNNFDRWTQFNTNTWFEGLNNIQTHINHLIHDNNKTVETKEFEGMIQNIGVVSDLLKVEGGQMINMNIELNDIIKTIKLNKNLTQEEKNNKIKLINECIQNLSQINKITSSYKYPENDSNLKQENQKNLEKALGIVDKIRNILSTI